MNDIQWGYSTLRGGICKVLALLLFTMGFLPYVPNTLLVGAGKHAVVYNKNPAWHFDGTTFEPGQWQGYFIMKGLLFYHENGDMEPIKIRNWENATVKTVAIATTNFTIPEVGVKLNTAAFCLRPTVPNWPNKIDAYEITPELCNQFTDISDVQIRERDIDALYIAMDTMGLNQDGVNFSNETYAAMRLLTWYVGLRRWNGKKEFMDGIDELIPHFDTTKINTDRFRQICQKAADKIDHNIGEPETGQTNYMPSFTGRYSSNASTVDFTDAGDGTYIFTYTYHQKYDQYWNYTCPAGVMVEYAPGSVTFRSTVPEPSGVFTGTPRPGSDLDGIIPSNGILICKSDDAERQDMLIPYQASGDDLVCYFKAGKNPDPPGESQEIFPSIPNIEFYKYEETFQSHYHISGNKYDAETNQPLSRAEFEVYEKSPANQPDILDNTWGSTIETWNNWKRCKWVETDLNGLFNHKDTRYYHYIGTYCGGHDTGRQIIQKYQDFIVKAEGENEAAQGDGTDPDFEPEPLWDVDAMKEHLAGLEHQYNGQIAVCEDIASLSGNHFFHGIDGDSDQKSNMTDDKQEAYNQFINLEYDYTIREIRAHTGYTIHGTHRRDNSIPVIRTASSESGKSGYVIDEDHKNAGLPGTYDQAFITGNTRALPGMLTRISKWKTAPYKDIQAGNPQASTSNATVYQQFISSRQVLERSSLIRGNTKATDSNAQDRAETGAKIPPQKATPSNVMFHFPQSPPEHKKAMDIVDTASGELDWQRGEAGVTHLGSSHVNLFTWYVYDHRVEGEVHMNKRDMELLSGEKEPYSSYGDTQGNATLEGAVYGLYAAQDIIHPDGKTGAVFKVNELVSIAATDKNGDASFLAITETSDTARNLKNNYDGIQTDANNPGTYPNNLMLNGNQWIGRPLILGRYYIKEIGRSEGYELSVTGKDMADTNYGAVGTIISDNGTAQVDSIRAGGGETSGTSGSVIEIKTEHANEGVELYLYHYPENTKFGIMRTGTEIRPGQSVTGWDERAVYVAEDGTHVFYNMSGTGQAYFAWRYHSGTGRYEKYETDSAVPLFKQHKAGDFKLDTEGNRIPVRNEDGDMIYTTSPQSKTVPYADYIGVPMKNVEVPGDIKDIRSTANRLLKEAGYYSLVPPSIKSPWVTMTLTGTPQEQIQQILGWYKSHSFYNAGCVETVTDHGDGTFTAFMRYDYLAASAEPAILYGNDIYTKEMIPGGKGVYYFVKYPVGAYGLEANMVTLEALRLVEETITVTDVIDDYIRPQFIPEYETYQTDEAILDETGQPIPVLELVPEISENTNVSDTKTIDYLTDIAEYIPQKKCFKVLIRPQRMTEHEKNGWLKIETVHTGGAIVVNGQNLQIGDYLKYVLGVGASAAALSEDWSGTYIKDVLLPYDGQLGKLYQDGDTRTAPIVAQERIIKQRVKVSKDILVNAQGMYDDNQYSIHDDWFTRFFGGLAGGGITARKLDNFRFKIYLKSNLLQIYRDNHGEIVWQNRKGEELLVDRDGNITDYKKPYPALVQGIYTKVLHQTDPLFQNSTYAVSANTALYGYTGDLINHTQNQGYTAVLETMTVKKEEGGGSRSVEEYNYKKFFDALSVVNHDKWDDAAPTYTSWRPVGNSGNQNESSIKNTKVSDMVRQFAITWYLDEEVKKLVRPIKGSRGMEDADGTVSQSHEIYDTALRQAIIKADNYLKPFFSYDLDEIYAVEWDGASDGGSDHDTTTLHADSLFGDTEADSSGYYFGISKYLPYGTYIIAEQQPRYTNQGDFANKHYHIDEPKEISLPSVYVGYHASQEEPEILNPFYKYSSRYTAKELNDAYGIRFAPESHIIQAQSAEGDFQIYQYGLSMDDIKNGSEAAGTGDYMALTQAEYKPYKNYYNQQDDRLSGTIPYYLSEGQSGRANVSRYYRYSSVAEQADYEDNVVFPGNGADGVRYRDHVAVMRGAQTAYEGLFAPMLVPWSVTDPIEEQGKPPVTSTGESSYQGYGYRKFHNRFYKTRFRIEKLDSETGENLLHDGAFFAIYAAQREDRKDGQGTVKFYEKDTVITGSKEFLEAMNASHIKPYKLNYRAGGRYSGTVVAGTPICSESQQIVLKDEKGKKTGLFHVLTTTRDGMMEDDELKPVNEEQNTGYLVSTQPLGAGVYVLAEIRPPSGYIRTKPIAVEVYSDKVSYYQNGNRDDRVVSVVYDKVLAPGKVTVPETAGIYVNNSPIKLEISKLKTQEDQIRYLVSGRLEGSITELTGTYGAENLEFAYNHSGAYLGYAWKKGTYENLEERRRANQNVEIVYEKGVFSGYGYVTRVLSTADDLNRYVSGALMTLHEGVQIGKSGDSQDYAYSGVVVERSRDGTVTNMYVKKGYAGLAMNYVMEGREEETARPSSSGHGTWTATVIQRGDTPILFYDLGGLKVTETGALGVLYGYDKHGRRVMAKNGTSLYAMKQNKAFLEITGEDFAALTYDAQAKAFTSLDQDTVIYHLGEDGSRDALVDPYTGMAYVPAQESSKPETLVVWPVQISKTEAGNIIAREKIKTGRLASIHAQTQQEYVTGTWNSQTGVFEKRFNPVVDEHGLAVYYQRSDEVYQKGQSLYDRDGDYIRYKYDDNLGLYYDAAYIMNRQADLSDLGKEVETQDDKRLYHRQGEAFIIENTWISGDRFPNDPTKTEVNMEGNDPQGNHSFGGQPDILKRVYPGIYILEELKPPQGYVKGLPRAVEVKETKDIQRSTMEDKTIKVEISKVDGTDSYKTAVIDRDSDLLAGTVIEDKNHYSHRYIVGAGMALFQAKRTYTSDWENYPKGYYLEKSSNIPYKTWITTEKSYYLEGIWAGDYILEETALPEGGGYLASSMEIFVEETGEVQNFTMYDDHSKVEIFKYYLDENGLRHVMPNTSSAKLSLYEAVTDEDGNIVMDGGIARYDADKPAETWRTDDCSDYTQIVTVKEEPKTGFLQRMFSWIWKREKVSGFQVNYENMYKEYGGEFDFVSWEVERYAIRSSKHSSVWSCQSGKIVVNGDSITYPAKMSDSERAGFEEAFKDNPDAVRVSWLTSLSASRIWMKQSGQTMHQMWRAVDGKQIRISVYQNGGRNGYETMFEYQFNYKKLGDKYPNGVSYTTGDGGHRIDYLPSGNYVLVETDTPAGFQTAQPKAVTVKESSSIQRYSMDNKEKSLVIIKTGNVAEGLDHGTSIKGAKLALYAADEAGGFTKEDTYLFDTWISGSEGNYTEEDFVENRIPDGFGVGDLKHHMVTGIGYGIYYLVELEAPAGYVLSMEPQKILVTADSNPVITLKNYMSQGLVAIYKYDGGQEKEPLAGATFQITNQTTGKELYVTTDEHGRGDTPCMDIGWIGEEGNIFLYQFTIREIVPPPYYQLDPVVHTFQFVPDGTQVIGYNYRISNDKTRLSIRKADFDHGGFVAGAQLSVFNTILQEDQYIQTGDAMDTWISDGKSHLVKERLKAGQVYLLREQNAPEGYIRSDPFLWSISEDGRSITNMTNGFQWIWFHPNKVNGMGEISVRGRKAISVETMLTDQDTGNMWIWTGTGEGRRLGRPDGIGDGNLYSYTETIHFSQGSSVVSESLTFRMNTQPDGSYVIKDRTYENTRLTVKNQDDDVIDSWIVQEDDRIIKGLLEKGDTYTLIEELLFSDGTSCILQKLQFTLGGDGNVAELMMLNRKNHVEIWKTDVTGKELLEGARLQITREDGTVEETWNSTGNPHIMKGKLKSGRTYILKEIHPPDGYAYASEMKFTVSEDGLRHKVVMADKSTHLEVSKKDITGQEELPGARLQIQELNGRVIEEWVSAKQPHIIKGKLVAGRSYVLKELLAPEGYVTAETIEFTISLDGKVDKVAMIDEHTTTTVVKVQEDEIPLPGAFMQIRDMDGKVMEEWISSQQPYVITGKLTEGRTYQLVEVKAPDGYLPAPPIEFVGGKDINIQMLDVKIPEDPEQPKEKYIEIIKKNNKGERLAGGGFAVYKINGYLAATGRTNQDGVFAFLLPASGDYYFIETKAPSGYQLTRRKFYFTVDEEGAVSGTMTVYNDLEQQPQLQSTPKPKAVETSGWITVSYESPASGFGLYEERMGKTRRIRNNVRTGDDTPIMGCIVVILGGVCTAGIIVARRRIFRKKGR